MAKPSLSPEQGDRIAKLNAVFLAVASGLAGANATVVFASGGIVGQSLTHDVEWATVPISAFVFGTMLATLPVAQMARRFGGAPHFLRKPRRRRGRAHRRGGDLSVVLLAVLPVHPAGRGLSGCRAELPLCGGGYGHPRLPAQSHRLGAHRRGGGGNHRPATGDLHQGVDAAASVPRDLPGQAALAVLAMLATAQFQDQPRAEVLAGAQRPLGVIIRQPRYIVAVACGAIAQALMNFVMTAAPLAMVQCGHSIVDATLGIQWHAIAMFAPSFFTGTLIQRFGKERMVIAGMVILISCGVVNLMGITVAHFWIALILLGLGWNFAFIGATSMVTDCHSPPSARGRRASMISRSSASPPWARCSPAMCSRKSAGAPSMAA